MAEGHECSVHTHKTMPGWGGVGHTHTQAQTGPYMGSLAFGGNKEGAEERRKRSRSFVISWIPNNLDSTIMSLCIQSLWEADQSEYSQYL